mgnify:CR=1 FL=1
MQQFRDRTIKVSVDNLLAILRENRTKHIEDFKEAYELFRGEYIETLEAMIADVEEEGLPPKMQIDLLKPVSYEQDYTQIIEMLEMSVDKEIEITATEFQAYVKDKWSWKTNLNLSFGTYIGKTY